MIVREYDMENILFKCVEFECEKTGTKLQKINMVGKDISYLYLLYGDSSYTLAEPVFEVIKKLMV